MSSESFALDEVKRRLKIEQTVREFLRVLEEQELYMEDGLVAWNMLGFSMFQDIYPGANFEEVQKHMIDFSNQLFESSLKQN